jgi:hypothetical protein
MNYNPNSPKPQMPKMAGPSPLEEALGTRKKLNQIKQRMNATYPKPQPERKKAFSSSPTQIDI